MRGRCFIGICVREQTLLAGIGRHGTANITANILRDYHGALKGFDEAQSSQNLLGAAAPCLLEISTRL
jgi:hypothetical protein